jgi:hypothetical protein
METGNPRDHGTTALIFRLFLGLSESLLTRLTLLHWLLIKNRSVLKYIRYVVRPTWQCCRVALQVLHS